MRTARHIGIFLFADVEERDAVGPWEVLSSWTRTWPDDGWRVVTFSERAGEVRCAKGMAVRADHGEADRPKLDVLVYPGGQGTGRSSRMLRPWTGYAAAARTARS